MSLTAQRYTDQLPFSFIRDSLRYHEMQEEVKSFFEENPLEEERREKKWEEILQYGQPPMDIPYPWVCLDLEAWVQYLLWAQLASKLENDPDLDITFQEWEKRLKDFRGGSLLQKFLYLPTTGSWELPVYKYLGVPLPDGIMDNPHFPGNFAKSLAKSHGSRGFRIGRTPVPEEAVVELIKAMAQNFRWGEEETYDWFQFEEEVKTLLNGGRQAVANKIWEMKGRGDVSGSPALRMMYGEATSSSEEEPFVSIRMALEMSRDLPRLKLKALKRVFQYDPSRDNGVKIGLLNAVRLFGGQADQWVQKNIKKGRNVHDAVYFLPQEEDKRLASLLWDGLKRGKSTSGMDMLCSSWNELSEEDKNLGFNELLQLVRSRVYPGQKDSGFAQEAAHWGVSKKDYLEMESRFVRSLTQPDFHPEVEVEYGNLKGYFLPRNDPRGLFLGQYTGCCQHPYGAGSACSWYGQEQENSGFFVVEDDGEVIAQSWTWENDEGLCFDNVEAKFLGNRSSKVFRVYEEAARQLWENNNLKAVTVGRGANDLPELSNKECSDLQLSPPKDFSGHTDCGNQVAFFTDPDWEGEEDPEYFISGLLEDDLESCQEVASQVYPEGWQFAGSEESDCGFAIWSYSDDGYELVGYATIESQNRYISDIAVLEEHRKYSFPLVREVLGFCSRFGGEWEADARESTSYRLLKLMERRKALTILSEEESEYSYSMGERMFRVRFSC